jgi:ABC-type dipeptide/oligopeptide/nickel transport system ATPase component
MFGIPVTSSMKLQLSSAWAASTNVPMRHCSKILVSRAGTLALTVLLGGLANSVLARVSGKADAIRLLERVSLPADESFLKCYPRQLSVGQAQRVLIAMAIVHRPRLLLADEPTSALDAVTQAEILQLFSRLNRELQMGILYISHDLLSVGSICARVAILSEGRVVEFNSTEDIFLRPSHPYTQALIASIPRLPVKLSSSQEERRQSFEARGESSGRQHTRAHPGPRSPLAGVLEGSQT